MSTVKIQKDKCPSGYDRSRQLLRQCVTAMTFVLLCIPAYARGVLDNLPDVSRLDGYESPDSVRARLASMPLHDIEGLWEMTGEGSLMAIERDPATDGASAVYRMIVVRSASVSVREGTVMGYLTPTSQRGQYDARIYSSLSDDHTRLIRPTRNVITLGDEGSRITFRSYGRKLRFNWWRLLLPYMYRTLITPIERSRGDLDGCIRVYPTPSNPLNPRYL
ncbi:MAG: hypothetical protein K2G27_09240 [Duncaniella sp.]|nr:hypothetical protein [Duncaniella sp.]